MGVVSCPRPDTIAGFVDGALALEEARAVEDHIDICGDCRRQITAIARTPLTHTISEPGPEPDPGEDGALGPGVRVGRYEVLRVVGSGGMGRVALAQDPELRRPVALKVLRPALWRRGGQAARDRLMAEAVAMAKITHPNIVTVFDVGSFGDQIFIAMEYVEGTTLGEWLALRPRSWREALEVCVAAGRGLAAAHEGGVVHRDCKPANILCGAGGRVLVSDFGLALFGDGAAGDGQVAGTIGYMSPEQMDGRAVDERSDQFSFCATAWEALFGARPFAGNRLDELRAAISRGPDPGGPRVPGGVRRALLRGLAEAPAARFPSMAALLAELERTRRPRAARRIAIGAGVGALGAVLAVVVVMGGGEKVTCSDGLSRLAGIWGAQVHEEVREAFAASGAPAADFDRFSAAVDRHAESWTAAYDDSCDATYERGEQSSALFDARMACLGGQRAQLEALLGNIAPASSPEVVQGAIGAALRLPSPEVCSARALSSRGAPAQFADNPVAHRRAALVDEALGRIKALHELSLAREARAILDPAVLEAEALGDPVRRGRLLHELGLSQRKNFEQPAAEKTLERAARLAAAGGDDRTAADAALQLLALVGLDQNRAAEAAALERAAERELARAREPELDAKLEFYRGTVALKNRDHRAAAAHAERARTLLESVFGPDNWRTAQAHRIAGTAASMAGDHEAAMAAFLRSIEITESALGPGHADVAAACNLISTLARSNGDYPRARRYAERALAIRERLFGADHPAVTHTLAGLAGIASDEGNLERARGLLERVVAAEERRLGPAHWQRATAMTTLAHVLRRQGQRDRARSLLEEALALVERDFGRDHAEAFGPSYELGLLLADEGRCAEAIPLLDGARRLAQIHGTNDPDAEGLSATRGPCARQRRAAQRSSPPARKR